MREDLIVFVLVTALTGCGSIGGTIYRPVPYAGVQADVTLAHGGGALGVACVFDLPLSAIVDTPLLVFTLPYAYASHGDEEGWSRWRVGSRP